MDRMGRREEPAVCLVQSYLEVEHEEEEAEREDTMTIPRPLVNFFIYCIFIYSECTLS